MEYSLIKSLLNLLVLFISIWRIKNENLKCPPDHFKKSDNLFFEIEESDNYGYIFKKIASSETYYDKWSGIIYNPDINFCYKYYDNTTEIPNDLENIIPNNILVIYDDEMSDYNLNENYVIIKRDDSNLKNFYKSGCKTENGKILFKFEDNIPTEGNTIDFYFSISNPFDTERKFRFETHGLQYKINDKKVEYTSNEENCLEIEEIEENENCPEDDLNEVENNDDLEEDLNEVENNDNLEDNLNEVEENICNPIKIIKICILQEEGYNSIFFPLSDEISIEPHSVSKVKVSVIFNKEEEIKKIIFYSNNQEEEKNVESTGQKIINYQNQESEYYFRYPDLENVNENELFKKYNPVKTNFEIRLVSDDDLYISSYEAMSYRKPLTEEIINKEKIKENNPLSLTYNGIYNSCEKNEQCIDFFGCFESEKKCKGCEDYKCLNCDENGCLKCPSNAIDDHWQNINNNYIDECHFAFLDISNFYFVDKKWEKDSIIIEDVPPAIHFRFTFDFWFYFDDYKILDNNIHVEVIYRDFMTIALTKENDNLIAYCIPLEWIYEFSFDFFIDFHNKTLLDLIEYMRAPFVKYDLGNEDKTWVYIKCAYNFDNNRIYINDGIESILPITQIYKNGDELQQNLPFEMKKFYGPNNRTSIRLQGFYYLNETFPAYTYIRNINIFREYMPQNMDLKYFNLFNFNNYDEFPQLLYSVPLDDIYYTENITITRNKTFLSQKRISFRNGGWSEEFEYEEAFEFEDFNIEQFKYYIYDYSNKNAEIKQEKFLHLNLYKANYTIEKLNKSKSILFQPKKYFQRLNLLKPNNSHYNDCEFEDLTLLFSCNEGEKCFQDNKVFICNDSSSIFYLDIENFTCKNYCENGYMMSPRDNIYNKRQYCSSKCAEHNNCPSQNLFYTNPSSFFKCNHGFFNMYYKCFSENEVFNENGKAALHFGNRTNSHNIYIPLKNENEEGYENYAIEAWIYPDIRLREFGYDNDIKLKKYHLSMKYEFYTFFMTDKLRFIFGNYTYQKFYKEDNYQYFANIILNENKETYLYSSDMLNLNNWNRLFFSIDKKNYYVSFQNNEFEQENILSDSIPLKSIIFCNRGQYMINEIKNLCSDVEWLDGYYKNIKVFDITHSNRHAAFYSFQYENDKYHFIKHYYIYNLQSISDNIIYDKFGGKNGRVIFPNDTDYSINPDNSNFINYEINFTPQDAFPDKSNYYISKYNNKSKIINLTFQKTQNDECEIPVGEDICLQCSNKRGIQGYHCYGDNWDDPETNIYYIFKNPIENGPEKLSLKINAEKLVNQRAVTIFFFIKLYGFIENISNNEEKEIILIYLDSNPQLYLAYETKWESLYFKYDGRIIYNYTNFKNKFGLWIPISIAAFREYNRTFTLNMVTASILYSNLGYNMGGGTRENSPSRITEFPKMQFTEFSITNKWIGLISDLKIYNTFILNAWGVIRYKNKDEVSKMPYVQIDLKSKDNEINCIISSDLLLDINHDIKIKCIPDFNPHWYNVNSQGSCVDSDQGEISGFQVAYCGSDLYPRKCLGNICYSGCAGYYVNQALEYKTDLFKNYYYTINSESDDNIYYYLVAKPLGFSDWNRFSHAEANNIMSPIDIYSLDFWFYTQNFRNVKNPKEQYYGNNYTINFDNFVIIWNYHTYIKVYYNKSTEYYNAQCIPLYVINYPEYTSNFKNEIQLTKYHNQWIHITCGVHLSENSTFITKSVDVNTKLFNVPTTIPKNKNVTLIIDENSPRGYGVTLISDIRLWKCYSCGINLKYFDYVKGDKMFYELLHSFENQRGSTKTSERYDYFWDEVEEGPSYIKIQETDYPGYNVLSIVGGYPECNEVYYTYLYDDSCHTLYNLGRMSDFNVSVQSSKTGRYSMSFWTFIEIASELSIGLNVIWQNHLSITMIKDKNNHNLITALCFPQAYLDNVTDLKGNEIYILYEKANNKERYLYPDSSGKWIYVRCSVDHTRYIYNMNDNSDLKLLGDILYGDTQNHRPFRFFGWKTDQQLIVQNGRKNTLTRIFLRKLRLFREFIDSRLDGMKYLTLDSIIHPLVFELDFLSTNSYNGLELYYRGSRENTSNDDFITYRGYLSSAIFNQPYPNYSTYPTTLYVQKFCPDGKKTNGKSECRGIQETYGLPDGGYYYPNSGYYLKLDTLTMTQDCVNSCRNGDSLYNKAYCLFTPNNENHVESCGTNLDEAGSYSIYRNNFKCTEGYTKVFYECIPNYLVKNSAMYFSGFYTFPQLYYETNEPAINDTDPYYVEWKESKIRSYYIEFFFKPDAINLRESNDNNYTYFFAYPHQIYKDTSEQIFLYNYYIQSSIVYPENNQLFSISNYEWNKIVIENLYDKKKKTFSIAIFVNYNKEPDFSLKNLKENNFLHFRGVIFCDKNFNSSCIIKGRRFSINWGMAWYKNIKVYKGNDVNINLVDFLSDNKITLDVHSLIIHWPFTVDYINYNYVNQRLHPTNNRMVIYNWDNFNNYDDETRENYSVDTFDYSLSYPGTFINGLTKDESNYVLGECYFTCKRCYSSKSNDCYECKEGYILFRKSCEKQTGSFFSTPLKDKSIETVTFKNKIQNLEYNFDLINTNPITFTIWIKFLGIEADVLNEREEKEQKLIDLFLESNTENIDEEEELDVIIDNFRDYNWPILYLYNKETYLRFNIKTKTLDFIINLQQVPIIAYSVNIQEYIGSWVHLGISKYISPPDKIGIFPHMFNLMFDKTIISPLPIFNPSKIPVYFNNIIFDTRPFVEYAYLRFYNNFWFGNYGKVTATKQNIQIQLIYSQSLFLDSNSCIKNDILDVEIPDIQNKINCIGDYLPYELNCGNDNLYFDLNLVDDNYCDECNEICKLNCFGNDKDKCTCDILSGKYWVGANEDYTKYKCQKVQNINFAFYNEFKVNELSISNNKEKAIYFWVIIFEYVKGNFNSLYIIWDKHFKIIVEKNNDVLQLKCYHDIDINDNSITSNYIITEISFGKWNYIRCQADGNNKVFQLNNDKKDYTPVKYSYYYDSSLIIKDNSNVNYGFSFIRELKLYSSFNFDFWDDSRTIFENNSLPYLLHYFRFIRSTEDLSLEQATDIIKDMSYNIQNLKDGRIGYNYVINYDELILCNLGFCYNEEKNECIFCVTPNCEIPKNEENKCLKCPIFKKYLHDDDTCTDKCESRYASVDYLLQCRKCDITCETCLNEDPSKCTSCHTIYNLVPDLYLCVTDCEEYSLTKLIDIPNMCGPFNCHGNIKYPINLSDTFDYNENKNEYKTIIIDKDNFHQIKAEIINNTAEDYVQQWIFDRDETIKLNKDTNRNYKNENDIPNESPFENGADLSKLEVNVKNSFFKYGFKYVFYLSVKKYSDNELYYTEVLLKFILIMCDYPLLDKMHSLPSSGFIGTAFLLSCRQCSDIKTDYDNLEYKFTHIENSDYLNNDNNNNVNEVIIQDWSKKNELIYKFNKINPFEKEKYKHYIKCYCRNEYQLINSTYIPILILEKNYTNNQYDLNEIDEIFNFDDELTSEQLSDRVELLTSLYENNNIFLNRTEVKNYDLNGIKGKDLYLYDPISKQNDFNCNIEGNSYLLYKFLYCDCKENYFGNLCQISKEAYLKILPVYKNIYTKILTTQNDTYNDFIIHSVHDLMKASSELLSFTERNYFTQVINYINNLIIKFPEEMIKDNRYEIFFEIYYYLFEFGIRGVNKYTLEHYEGAEEYFDENKLRNSSMNSMHQLNIKSYFDYLKEGLNNLVNFYAINQKELKYTNRDFNIYIAIVINNFDFDGYFKEEKSKYEPYISASLCLNQILNGESLTIMIGINYKISPYLSNYYLFWDNSSPIITIKFLDINTKKKIYLQNCNSYLKFYFPVSQYQIVNRLNEKKHLLSPENQNSETSSILVDPVYIDKKGKVYKSSLEERRNKNYLPFNFSCNEIFENTNDNTKNISQFPSLDYIKYTDDNYIICASSNLLSEDYNEFVVQYFDLYSKLHTSSRFFYLKRYELYFNKDNYFKNPIFFYYISLFIFAAILLIIFKILLKVFPANYAVENYIKRIIVKQNIPYTNIEQYDLHDDIRLSPEDKNKIKKEKKLPKSINTIKEKNETLNINDEKTKKINTKFFQHELNSEVPISSRPLKESSYDINTQRENYDFFKEYPNKKNVDDKVSKFFQGNPPIKNKLEINSNNALMVKSNPIVSSNDKIQSIQSTENKEIIKSKKPKLHFYNDDYKETLKIYGYNKEEKNINLKFKIKVKNQFDDNINVMKKPLPDLDSEITKTKLLIEFYNLEITSFSFFKYNFVRRYILFNLFGNFSLLYHRYQRVLNCIAQFSLYTLFLSILFTLDENIIIIPKAKNNNVIITLILYCFVSNFFSCILIYFPSLLFHINIQKTRKLYCLLKEGNYIEGLKFFETIMNRKYYNLGGILIDILFILLSFYFSFGFCATYLYQKDTFIIGVAICIISDLLIWELIYEFLLSIFYMQRKCGKICIKIIEFLNRMRTVKSLN